MDLSILTATRKRPKCIAMLLHQVRQQLTNGLKIEHVVVSDGPDPLLRAIIGETEARYFELEATAGNFGAAAKDYAIQQAKGKYLCLWDDDNLYEPSAAISLYTAASGHEIGIVQTAHWSVTNRRFVTIPPGWTGKVIPGKIDTMCLCVRRELAMSEKWDAPPSGRGTDHRWLSRLCKRTDDINFVPIVIGQHLTF